jgi:hypothetical protein
LPQRTPAAAERCASEHNGLPPAALRRREFRCYPGAPPMKLAPLMLVAMLALGDEPAKDVVVLTAGSKVEGRVVYQDPKLVVVRIGTKEREIEMKDVAKVVSRAAMHHEAMEHWLKLDPKKLHDVLQLMDWCRESQLRSDSELFAWLGLAMDPTSEEAHTLLAHEQKGASWIVRDGAKRIEWERLQKVREDWGNAWQLDTTHYHLRTNAKLADATRLALALECNYKAFFELFAIDLHLYEVVEPMLANVHADKKSFPEITGSNGAYFDSTEHTLIIDASNAVNTTVAFHEATHQLIDATATHTRANLGDIPAWLNEGLADFMAYSMVGEAGRFEFDRGALAKHYFKLQAESKNPYDLSRVLTFASDDYLATSNRDLKYAQSYTLVHFLMYAGAGKYRAPFMAFVRAAYKGQSSSTEFKSAIGVEERALEKEWIAYVKQIGGK